MCSRSRFFESSLLAACSLAITGCPGARAVYGDRAFYAPDFRGYVVSVDSGRADPPRPERDAKGPWMVLLDPVTHDKLRCREDVDAAIAANAAALAALNQDGNAYMTSYGVAAPIHAVGYTLAITGFELLDGTALPYWADSPPMPITLLGDGVKAFRAGDYEGASHLLETALLRETRSGCYGLGNNLVDAIRFGPSPTIRDRSFALYYLGLAYEAQDRGDRAVAALSEFVDAAIVRDEVAYDLAEAHLRRLGTAPRECKSTSPVAVAWPDPS